MVHSSARPRTNSGRISTGAKTSANEQSTEIVLTDLDERPNRRSFTAEEKRAIVMEAEAPDISVAAVARRHEIAPSMIFRWRVQFGFGKSEPVKFAAVRVAGKRAGSKRNAASEAVVLHELLPIPDGFMAVDLPDGRQVFAPAGSDPDVVRQQVSEREVQP